MVWLVLQAHSWHQSQESLQIVEMSRLASGVALVVILLSFALMWLTGQWLINLIFGVILLDVGVQVIQVTCQTRLFSLNPAARNRFNTIYMFMFFLGGSLGSLLGTIGWSVAKWNGICGIACFLLIVALGFYILNSKRIRKWKMMQYHPYIESYCSIDSY